jgi:DNA repair protein RadC
LGAGALSDAELIAILLRVGAEGENAVQVGQRLLNTFGGIGGIHQASFDEVVQQRGLGMAKAAQLKAAIELGRRLSVLYAGCPTVDHFPTGCSQSCSI